MLIDQALEKSKLNAKVGTTPNLVVVHVKNKKKGKWGLIKLRTPNSRRLCL